MQKKRNKITKKKTRFRQFFNLYKKKREKKKFHGNYKLLGNGNALVKTCIKSVFELLTYQNDKTHQ